MNTTFLSLGSNLGERAENLTKALLLIKENIGQIIITSSIYETEPWACLPAVGREGNKEQEYFLNQVIKVQTEKTPQELLFAIQAIEAILGRKREYNPPKSPFLKGEKKWQERTMDIDILFYNDAIIQDNDLIIPHPLLHKRKFVLVPLCEIDENFLHPVLKKTIKEILLKCEDNSEVICSLRLRH